jgi:hypothetical protein
MSVFSVTVYLKNSLSGDLKRELHITTILTNAPVQVPTFRHIILIVLSSVILIGQGPTRFGLYSKSNQWEYNDMSVV